MSKAKDRKKARKSADSAQLKPKQRLKLVLGKARYKALKKKCCSPKHPHCHGCPLLKALANLSA
jgi:hypothetical protein